MAEVLGVLVLLDLLKKLNLRLSRIRMLETVGHKVLLVVQMHKCNQQARFYQLLVFDPVNVTPCPVLLTTTPSCSPTTQPLKRCSSPGSGNCIVSKRFHIRGFYCFIYA